MKADISTKITVRAARRLVAMRKKVHDLIPYGPMVVDEDDEDVARREMKSGGQSLADLAKLLGIKEK